jgi:DNA-binding GntR family transcriptional regulator
MPTIDFRRCPISRTPDWLPALRYPAGTPPTLVDHIVSTLSELILSKADNFHPGERLRIAALCELFGSSPTPVKEALRQLEAEGLVVIEPRRGARVAAMSQRDFEEIFQLRVELEAMALRLLNGRPEPAIIAQLQEILAKMQMAVDGDRVIEYHQLDCAFHSLVVSLAGNSRLSGFYTNLMTQYRIRPAYMSTTTPGMTQSLTEHRDLVGALEMGDRSRAKTLVQQHWTNARLRAERSGATIEGA